MYAFLILQFVKEVKPWEVITHMTYFIKDVHHAPYVT
jgi:hypothetical protein